MKRLGLLLTVLGVVAAVGVASAAQVGSEGQVATFEAKLSPSSLPRKELAPVQIRVEGEFRATPDNHLAELMSMEIGVNRHGRIFPTGLPVCHRPELIQTNSADALKACRPALVGHGLLTTTSALKEQHRVHIRARVLAFNGRSPGGGLQIFIHVHGAEPFPYTVIFPIKVRRTKGTFGTSFLAALPDAARRWAYLTKFRFVIGRRFMVDGRPHSYLRANCPAPKGLTGAVFPFAKATYRFATTKTLRSTLVGSCHVRGG
jgi:hypothetical protein